LLNALRAAKWTDAFVCQPAVSPITSRLLSRPCFAGHIFLLRAVLSVIYTCDPFRLAFQPGVASPSRSSTLHQGHVSASFVRRPFPSVRTLSKELKINPTRPQVSCNSPQGLVEVLPASDGVAATLPSQPPPRAYWAANSKACGGSQETRYATGRRLAAVTRHWQNLAERNRRKPPKGTQNQ